MIRGSRLTLLTLVATLASVATARAQDANVLRPIPDIEHRLTVEPFTVQAHAGTRFAGDRTQRAVLIYPDSVQLMVKWAAAPPGGEAFNNEPRYELAAYELQKLFLDPKDYVVPPTELRAISLNEDKGIDFGNGRTFEQADAVIVELQYWLWNITAEDVYDKKRFDTDSVYARHLGDFNILTYLIKHGDSNQGNFLVSKDTANPRVFTVDNGVAFESQESNRGHAWAALRVKRLPAGTVGRLRKITPENLQRFMGVLAQWDIKDRELVRTDPGPNLDPSVGVRVQNGVAQMGLTKREIDGIWDRIQDLLKKVDKGDIKTF
jgi:hypothetical protein